ncbi:MAG: hypothetical protein H6Q86_5308 [candidate division NC10 bacterium]|nr:hypothetical protein [candidate division NC10 bacterium]
MGAASAAPFFAGCWLPHSTAECHAVRHGSSPPHVVARALPAPAPLFPPPRTTPVRSQFEDQPCRSASFIREIGGRKRTSGSMQDNTRLRPSCDGRSDAPHCLARFRFLQPRSVRRTLGTRASMPTNQAGSSGRWPRRADRRGGSCSSRRWPSSRFSIHSPGGRPARALECRTAG